MPYIKPENRERYKKALDELVFLLDQCNEDNIEGETNYVITTIMKRLFGHKYIKYRHLNRAIGILECAKLEFYRRTVAPYEDKKIEENGDV